MMLFLTHGAWQNMNQHFHKLGTKEKYLATISSNIFSQGQQAFQFLVVVVVVVVVATATAAAAVVVVNVSGVSMAFDFRQTV